MEPAARAGREGHVLLLHRNETERCEAVAAWVSRGLRQGEKVFCAEPPDTFSAVFAGLLREQGVDPDAARATGRLVVGPVERLHLEGRAGAVARALGEGYPGVRLAARLGAPLARLEAPIERLCRTLPFSALCAYDAPRLAEPELAGAVSDHPEAVHEPRLTLRRCGDRLELEGDVDTMNADLVQVAVATAARAPAVTERLVVDLGRLGFIDVAGVRALLVGTEPLRERGGRLRLVGTSEMVRKVLVLLGVPRQPGVDLELD